MKKTILINFILISLFASSCIREKQDYDGLFNHSVFGFGPFTQVTDSCAIDSELFSSWFIFDTDSTFLFYDSFMTQSKLSSGKYTIDKNQISMRFNAEIIVTKEIHALDAPPLKEITHTIQDEYDQTFWISNCGNKLKLRDENGIDLGIQIPNSYDEKIQFLKNERLISK